MKTMKNKYTLNVRGGMDWMLDTTIDKKEFFKDIREVLNRLNNEIHSDTPPVEKYGEKSTIPLEHGSTWVEFNFDGPIGETIDWTGKPIEDFLKQYKTINFLGYYGVMNLLNIW